MKKIKRVQIKDLGALTFEGAAAYSLLKSDPRTHLTFTLGSALITDAYYQSEVDEVFRLYEALKAVVAVEPKFAWQYAAWMRDPKNGKGNRIQGSLVPAMLDGLTPDATFVAYYVQKCLSFRPDDVVAFFQHFERLGLGGPSVAARQGAARALTSFDEYQLMKYANAKAEWRLCDVIAILRDELTALGADGELALNVGAYLHASSRDRKDFLVGLPITRARKLLWSQPKGHAMSEAFASEVQAARVTWEQVYGHFGTQADENRKSIQRNHRVWKAVLSMPGLMGDLAFMRNLRNFMAAGIKADKLQVLAKDRGFREVWPHQVFSAFKAVPEAEPVLDVVFEKIARKLPSGRHLGIADVSGSMAVKVGGAFSTTRAMDVALTLTALMSHSSGLGASFCDESMMSWSGADGKYLHIARRRGGLLDFIKAPELNRGWGGTQVFGAVMDLILWLQQNRDVKPPDCLWFFSDMQFHPAVAVGGPAMKPVVAMAKKLGVGFTNVPPLEVALRIYRQMFGAVDVVLWNLAAYAPVPVPSDMEGVLLVSGFDTNTFSQVETWRKRRELGGGKMATNQNVVLETIRRY